MRLSILTGAMLVTGAVAACHDDDRGAAEASSSGAGAASAGAGASTAQGGQEVGGAPGDEGAGAAPANPLYAVMYEVYDDVGSTSYLSLFDSLDLDRLDVSRGREYLGGRAFLQAYAGWVFVGDATTPKVTRYSVDEAGNLEEEGDIGFGNYGLEAGSLDDWNITFISRTKAYLFDFKEGTTIIWNPTTLEITGEIAPAEEFARPGFSFEGSPAALRGSRLYRAFNWVNYDTAEYSTDVLLGIYDVETDQLVELVEETRCPALGNLVHHDEAGTIYFSNWIWPIAGTLMRGAPESCVLRINPDQDSFDASWKLDYSELTGGRQGAMFSYLGDEQALFSVFHDERVAFDETTDAWEYAGSQNWSIWSLDMGTLTAGRIRDIDFSAGAFTPVSVDGRSFIMVPNSTWSATQLYEIVDGRAEPAMTVPGWTYQFEKVR